MAADALAASAAGGGGGGGGGEGEEERMRLLTPGTTLQVLKNIDGTQFYQRAQIMSQRVGDDGQPEFYIHFSEFNKRLDEWVPLERLDLSTVERKGPAAAAPSHGGGAVKAARSKKSASRSSRSASTSSSSSKKRKRDRGRAPPRAAASQEGGEADGGGGEADSGGGGGGGEIVAAAAVAEAEMEKGKEDEFEKLRRGGSMTQRTEEISRVKNIDRIEMGRHIVQTWYFSPYPREICGTTGRSTVYICEFCLSYFGARPEMERHRQKCLIHHPPGAEIYRSAPDGRFSFWELDGHKQKIYCRNLCLLSKLFLDHKTLFYDVDPFLFYVLTENDGHGCHLIGYFSRKKNLSTSTTWRAS